MSYSAPALSAAIKAALDLAEAEMLSDIQNEDPSTMKQDFCDLVATAIVDHLNAHPVVIPAGTVLIAATGGVLNPTPLATAVT
jgi:hypothetical protein